MAFVTMVIKLRFQEFREFTYQTSNCKCWTNTLQQ